MIPAVTRSSMIQEFVKQVEEYNFQFLYRNSARSGICGRGWAGALNLYSPNAPAPSPSDHFQWLSKTLAKRKAARSWKQKIDLANAILKWGGMRTTISKTKAGSKVLNLVIDSASNRKAITRAPMNSSYTKIAAVFGYEKSHLNTIWDSRVSTALCFRLAHILMSKNEPAESARHLFPDLGYVSGISHRVSVRLETIRRFWPNVYQKWSGHYAGAEVSHEIALELRKQKICCPSFPHDPNKGSWDSWKVNMVLFMDDIVPIFAHRKSPQNSVLSQGARTRQTTFDLEYRIVNWEAGIHFEPLSIAGPLNLATGLVRGEHGLNDRRLLLEFFRMSNGNCKISCRVRTADENFEMLYEAALDAGCPQKKGGIKLNSQTESIFVYPLARITKGEEVTTLRDFVERADPSYFEFLSKLPALLSFY